MISVKEFRELQSEFLQYGYDPYNSEDAARVWFACKEAGLDEPRLRVARYVHKVVTS